MCHFSAGFMEDASRLTRPASRVVRRVLRPCARHRALRRLLDVKTPIDLDAYETYSYDACSVNQA